MPRLVGKKWDLDVGPEILDSATDGKKFNVKKYKNINFWRCDLKVGTKNRDCVGALKMKKSGFQNQMTKIKLGTFLFKVTKFIFNSVMR